MPPKRILKRNFGDKDTVPCPNDDSVIIVQHSETLALPEGWPGGGSVDNSILSVKTEQGASQQVTTMNMPRVWQLCRMCAGSADVMIGIFTEEGRQQQLAGKMRQHLLLTVSDEDSLPLRVCSRCVTELEGCHQLAQRCAQADATLRALLSEEETQGVEGWNTTLVDSNRVEDSSWVGDNNLANMAHLWLTEQNQHQQQPPPPAPHHLPAEQPPSEHHHQGLTPLPPVQTVQAFAVVSAIQAVNSISPPKVEPVSVPQIKKRGRGRPPLKRREISHADSHFEFSAVENSIQWTCLECNLNLLNLESFKIHQREAHAREQLPCNKCGIFCDSSELLLTHFRDQHAQPEKGDERRGDVERTSFVLRSRRRVTVLKRNLILPTRTRQQRRIYEPKLALELTDEILDDLENVPLRERLRDKDHRKLISFHCQVCGAEFEDLLILQEHLSVEHSQYECRVCEQLFPSEEEAKQHAEGPHDITCEQCHEGFPTQRSLKIHTVQMHQEGKRRFVCSECGHRFISKITLRAHMKTHDCKRTTVCEVCGKGFRTYDALKQHKFTHMTEEEKKNIGFPCTMCEKKFSRRTKLEYHMRRHTNERHFSCTICTKSFHDSVRLKAHLERHSTDKKFKCDECGSGFVCKRYLTNHKSRYHRRREVIRCSVCKMAFKSTDEAVRHYDTHSEEEKAQSGTSEPYTQSYDHHCRQCCEYFPSKEQLAAHRAVSHVRGRSHKTTLTPLDMAELVKQLDCSICGKKLWGAGSLKRHMSSHSNKRPERTFQCEFCAKMFAQKAQLVVHIRTHTGERPHRCSFCGKGFITGQSLVKHERIHTGETPYHCSQCPKAFRSKENLILHQKTHLGLKPYECHFCHKRFGRQIHLQLHLRTHTGERPYVCDICGRAFAQGGDMRRHRLTHTGERAYKCEMCSFSSNKRKSLRDHQAAAHGLISRPSEPAITIAPAGNIASIVPATSVVTSHSVNMGVDVTSALISRQVVVAPPPPPAPVANMVPVSMAQHIMPTVATAAAAVGTQYVALQDSRIFISADLHKNWSEN